MKSEKLQCEKLCCFEKNAQGYPGESLCETLMFVSKEDFNEYCRRCTGNTIKEESVNND